jgi:hypothetical protein
MKVLRLPALAAVAFPALLHAGISSIEIINPGFEADVYGTFPGYNGQPGNPAAPTGWTAVGGNGVNAADTAAGLPFSDNTTLDGPRLSFIQGTGSLTQTISGLVVGQRYVFQGWFRPRNCCGDSPIFSVSLGSTPLITNQPMAAGSPWQAFTVPFVADAASGALQISSAPQAAGDASLAFDGMGVFQLNNSFVTLQNASFEAGGISFPFPGYISGMAGWTKTGPGGFGYNFAGNTPFADNGLYPEGRAVAFLQNDGTIAQTVDGLTAGQLYRFELDYNTRDFGDDAHILVQLGGSTLLDTVVTPVGGANPWHRLSANWVASGNSAALSISNILDAGKADATLVLDNINLQAIPEPSSALMLCPGVLLLRRRRR